jgi:transcriptional regulator with XRE-family HTH domain
MFTPNDIRLLRMTRQIKQETIAKKMNITKQRYSELENNGNLRLERITEILTILGYTIEDAKKYLESIPPHVSLRS